MRKPPFLLVVCLMGCTASVDEPLTPPERDSPKPAPASKLPVSPSTPARRFGSEDRRPAWLTGIEPDTFLPLGPAVVGEEFSLELKTDIALEDGPLLFVLRLRNHSAHEAGYYRARYSGERYVEPETDWPRRGDPLGGIRGWSGPLGPFVVALAPGQDLAEPVPLHGKFLKVPPGRIPVRYGWKVAREHLAGRATAEVMPATAANVAAVRERLERRAARAEEYLRAPERAYSDRPAREVVDALTGSPHREFVPLLLRVLGWSKSSSERILDTVYDSFPATEDGFEVLLNHLKSPDPVGAVSIMWYWWWEPKRCNVPSAEPDRPLHLRHRDIRPTPGDHSRLLTIENVWVRAAYYHYFPDQSPDSWVVRLLADLGRQSDPPPADRVARILADLESPRFAVRERATRAAMTAGSSLAPVLRDLRRDHPSADLAARVDEILSHYREHPLSPVVEEVLGTLVTNVEPQDVAMVDAIVRGNPSGWLAAEVQSLQKAVADRTYWHRRR